jgi:hypothetical protein
VPYLVVSDFKGGLDRRKSIVTAAPGSLWTAKNVHITRGGEIEKRKSFRVRHALPVGTFGFITVLNDKYVFGSAVAPSMPSGVLYQRLQHPSGLAMTRLVAATLFAGKIFAIAEYTGGVRALFYDGTIVPEWTGVGTYASLADQANDCITMRSKVIVAAGSSLVFSKLNDASTFAGTGAGIIDASTDQTGLEEILALSKYQGLLAVYARRLAQTWTIDVDLSKCAGSDPLENTGIIASRSAVPFGNTDTFILNDTGVRSIRAREGTNTPGIYDIGTPIDTLITDAIATLGDATAERAAGVMEPIDGRYLLALGTTVYVFSYFPGSKVSAWTTYDLGGEVEAWGIIGTKLFCRIADSIYEYGASDLGSYDSSPVEVVLPYLDGQKPAHEKQFVGIDASVEGEWTLSAGMNIRSPDTRELVANLSGPSFVDLRYAATGRGTHIGLKLTNTASGAARIGNIIVHFEQEDAD